LQLDGRDERAVFDFRIGQHGAIRCDAFCEGFDTAITIAGKPSGPAIAGESQHNANHQTGKRWGRVSNGHAERRRIRLFDAVNEAVAVGHLAKTLCC